MELVPILNSALNAAFGTSAAAFALLAIGLNVHFGYTGLLNFGQVGFMLVGAYGMSITMTMFGWPLWLGLVGTLVFAVVLALLLGLPTLRLRADYFAITTIAAAEVLRIVFRSTASTQVTGGPYGQRIDTSPLLNLNPFDRGLTLGPFNYTATTTWWLTIAWGLVILASLLVLILMRSPWGRVLKSIREDEDAVRSLGKNVFSYKMQALVLGGIIGALGGVVWSLPGSGVTPDVFRPQITFYAYAILILGGIATRWGPVVGAVLFMFVLQTAQLSVRQADGAGLLPPWLAEAVGPSALLLTGVLLMIMVVYRPQGIFGSRREIALDV